MGAILCGTGRIDSAVTLGNFGNWGFAASSNWSTEARAAFTNRIPGIYRYWGARVNASGTGRSVRFRKGSANANMTVSFTDSTAQAVYAASSLQDRVETAGTFDYQTNGAGTAFTLFWVKAVFFADRGHAAHYGGGTVSTSPTIQTNWQAPIGGYSTLAETTRARNEYLMSVAGTVSNIQAHVTTNGQGGTCTPVFVKNGVDGNQTFSIGGGVTGVFEDTTHTDTVVDTDTISMRLAGGNPSSTLSTGCVITYNAQTNEVVYSQIEATITSAGNKFFAPVGGGSAPVTTEASAQLQHGFRGRSSRLKIKVGVTGYTAVATLVFRKNGATANQSVSITNGATGWFEDASHTDDFTATDDCCYMLSGGTSGSTTFGSVGALETPLQGSGLLMQPPDLDGIGAGGSFFEGGL